MIIKWKVKGDEQAIKIRLRASTYDGACSALSHLYHGSEKNNEAISPQIWSKLSSYKKGSRRIAASEKQDLGLNLT